MLITHPILSSVPCNPTNLWQIVDMWQSRHTRCCRRYEMEQVLMSFCVAQPCVEFNNLSLCRVQKPSQILDLRVPPWCAPFFSLRTIVKVTSGKIGSEAEDLLRPRKGMRAFRSFKKQPLSLNDPCRKEILLCRDALRTPSASGRHCTLPVRLRVTRAKTPFVRTR
jgi:hypothetical protein